MSSLYLYVLSLKTWPWLKKTRRGAPVYPTLRSDRRDNIDSNTAQQADPNDHGTTQERQGAAMHAGGIYWGAGQRRFDGFTQL